MGLLLLWSIRSAGEKQLASTLGGFDWKQREKKRSLTSHPVLFWGREKIGVVYEMVRGKSKNLGFLESRSWKSISSSCNRKHFQCKNRNKYMMFICLFFFPWKFNPFFFSFFWLISSSFICFTTYLKYWLCVERGGTSDCHEGIWRNQQSTVIACRSLRVSLNISGV